MIDNDVYESIKYVGGVAMSGILSIAALIFKRRAARMARMETSVNEISTQQSLFDLEIRTLKEDVAEIKHDIKQLLFKNNGGR